MSSTGRWVVSPVLLALCLAVLSCGAGAQGPAAAPMGATMDCTTALANMSACLTYVEMGSNQTVPDKGCCPGLASMVDNQPICLCELLSSADTYGIQIDTTKALTLPTVCRVNTPPVSLCSVLGIPVAAPMSGGGLEEPGSPMGSTPLTGSGTPAVAPSVASNTGSSGFRATGLAFLLGVSIIAIF